MAKLDRPKQTVLCCLGGALLFLGLLPGCRHDAIPAPTASASPAATPTPYSFLGLPEHDEHRGRLRTYYGQKYTQQQIAAVKGTVEEVLADYSPADRSQATAEILAFNDVVFHITPYHHLDRNHSAIRPHESKLKELCQQYSVPFYPVLAIVSWENSGDSGKVSWADAAGLGQMTWGAIDEAHRFAKQQAELLPDSDPLKKRLANLETRHSQMSKHVHSPDERFVPDCNLEDVVLFFKFLLSKYGGAADHAIGAYHKGLANQDDIVRDYIRRKEGSCPDPIKQRDQFIEALRRNRINYLTLWNDRRSREMLNGLRTLDGDPTTRQNASQALGDESDIYPWKVLGSLCAYRQGPEYVHEMQAKYEGPQVDIEVAGLPLYTAPDQIAAAIKAGDIVRTVLGVNDLGIDANVSPAHRDMAYSITPELEGYLWGLTQRWRQRATNNELVLPTVRLLAVGDLAAGHHSIYDRAQLRGVTVQLMLADLSEKEKEALKAEIQVDYLFDKVYRSTLANKNILLCLNPRFGPEFKDLYEKRLRGEEAPEAHDRPRAAVTPQPAPTSERVAAPIQPTPTPEASGQESIPTPDSGDPPKDPLHREQPKAGAEM